MTRVLVTGAGGFVGLPLVARLVGAGHELHAVSTRVHPPEAGVRWHRADLADEVAVQQLIDRVAPEWLVHLAWCTEHGHFWRATENLAWMGRSLHLIRAFVRGGGRRMLIVGTCAEYDWRRNDGPFSELGAHLLPANLYGVSKDALRRVAQAYADQEAVELAWGRLFFLYGPRESPGRLVPSIIRAQLAGEVAETSSGRQARDFLHVDDVAGALAALLDGPVVGAVNIASGVAVTVGELVDQIVALTGHPELVHRGALPDRPDEPRSLVADVTRLRHEVGFHPQRTLAEGLAGTLRWWEEHG